MGSLVLQLQVFFLWSIWNKKLLLVGVCEIRDLQRLAVLGSALLRSLSKTLGKMLARVSTLVAAERFRRLFCSLEELSWVPHKKLS